MSRRRTRLSRARCWCSRFISRRPRSWRGSLGWIVAIIYAVSLPFSATWDFRYADRIRRAIARIRTYLRFRRDPDLHRAAAAELAWLRDEAVALDARR